jgi:DNA-binding CsgD family transcriptional regulator
VTNEFWRLFTESRLPMLLLDDDRVFVAANDAGCLSLKRPHSEIVGQRMEQTTAPALRPKLSQLWRESRDTGHIAAPWQFVLSDGATIDVDSILTRETPEPGRHLWLHWPRRRTADGRVLSPREQEITNLIASGLTAKQIAQQLYLSPETVRTHIRNAMTRMRARTRAQLVALAIGRGLISGDLEGGLPTAESAGS